MTDVSARCCLFRKKTYSERSGKGVKNKKQKKKRMVISILVEKKVECEFDILVFFLNSASIQLRKKNISHFLCKNSVVGKAESQSNESYMHYYHWFGQI